MSSPPARRVWLGQAHDALAHGGHLRPVLGADDGGDDVAAEGGTDLQQDVAVRLALGRVLADLQVGAVGGEAAAQRAGDARRQVAAGRRGAEEHDLRLVAAHEVGDHVGVGRGEVGVEALVAGDVGGVGAAAEGERRRFGRAAADEHGAHAGAEPVGQLAGAAEQLEADVGDAAVVELGDDPDLVWWARGRAGR